MKTYEVEEKIIWVVKVPDCYDETDIVEAAREKGRLNHCETIIREVK